MKIEIEELTDLYVKFILKDTFISYANSLRRILISEVPTITIDLVEIKTNNTALPDEVISHRLGLIPLYSRKELLFRDECSCDDTCDECSISLSLKVSNTGDTPLLVTCKDIKCDSDDVFIRSTPIIVKLGTNQSIDVQCKAFKGIGKIHSKWSPVAAIGYEYDKTNKTRSTNYWLEKGNVNEEWSMQKQEESDLLCEVTEVQMCVEIVEGFGKPLDILLKALEIMKKKFIKLREDLSK